MDEIARRLEQLREAKGWSGREFSRNAKLGEAQFRQIQVRGGARASTTTLRAFAEAASASLDWLLTGDGAPFPDATPAEPKRAGNGPSSSHNFSEFPRYSELEKAAHATARPGGSGDDQRRRADAGGQGGEARKRRPAVVGQAGH